MTGAGEVKRWIKVGRTAQGVTSATVTLMDGALTAKWAVRSAPGQIKESVKDAEKYAQAALAGMREALAEIEEA